jgi:hypothetical protein
MKAREVGQGKQTSPYHLKALLLRIRDNLNSACFNEHQIRVDLVAKL